MYSLRSIHLFMFDAHFTSAWRGGQANVQRWQNGKNWVSIWFEYVCILFSFHTCRVNIISCIVHKQCWKGVHFRYCGMNKSIFVSFVFSAFHSISKLVYSWWKKDCNCSASVLMILLFTLFIFFYWCQCPNSVMCLSAYDRLGYALLSRQLLHQMTNWLLICFLVNPLVIKCKVIWQNPLHGIKSTNKH